MNDQEHLDHPLVKEAVTWATQAHRNQKYGTEPYMTHVEGVVKTLLELGAEDLEKEPQWFRNCILAAAYLHDVVEDTDVTVVEIARKFGDAVASLVEALTKESGLCRKCANKRNNKRLQNNRWARRIKLCDRLANMEEGVRVRNSKLTMYIKEYRDFREALYIEDDRRYWEKLDSIFQKESRIA